MVAHHFKNIAWNPLKKMRVLWVNICIILICILAVEIQAAGFKNIKYGGPAPEEFDKDLKNLVRTHFNLSLRYLYAGVGYGHQKLERPGLAKYLRELSNRHWEEGMKLMKKYFIRGGSAKNMYSSNAFKLEGKNNNAVLVGLSPGKSMMEVLNLLVRDSRDYIDKLNKLHNMAVRSPDFHDGDWGHYLEEQLEEEEKKQREFLGHVTTLSKMSSSNLALKFFDSSL